jgi:hypothetical protein
VRSLYIIGVTLAALLAAAMVANIGEDEQENDDRQRKLSVMRFLRRLARR